MQPDTSTNHPLSSGPAPSEQPQFPLRREYERIAQKMYTQNLALARTNQTLTILRSIDLLILESSRELQQLSLEIAQAIVDSTPYALVAILSLNRYNDRFINFQGLAYSTQLKQSGIADVSLDLRTGLYMSLDSDWLQGDQRNLIVSLDSPGSAAQIQSLGVSGAIQDALETYRHDFNVRSYYLSKLYARKNLTGVMLVGLEETTPKIDDIELIERLSEPTGIALDNRLLFEENQRFLQQLQTTNANLQELDAAKDEFISLVSHQLRTPLTSIKGFLSMVLEGDVGTVTDPQRQMLKQAFDSSQRLVYLIADLLNASRLRSGKLVISNIPTYLPDLVESEMSQLLDSAKSRGVSFEYVKPATFPKVMLDETKIRQVVMNFMDNALFYTPRGGRVRVALKDTEKTIELSVSDSGVGVPKADQSKLFTKFYRAGNAKKLRPEGTGLGLYMAKKVIVAEGGAILFSSVEGKGSVFGFVFPREKIELSDAGSANEAGSSTMVISE